MDEISHWLSSGRDFEQGRELYNAYAPRYRENRAVAFQINQAENSISRALLREELEAILAIVQARHEVAKTPTPEVESFGDLPLDLAKIEAQIPKLYKQRDYLRYESRKIEPGPTLLKHAVKIVQLDRRIRESYRILKYWKRTGTYPPDYTGGTQEGEEKLVAKLTAWLRAMKSYPSWISRNKAKPELAAEVERRRKVLEEINEYLDHAAEEE